MYCALSCLSLVVAYMIKILLWDASRCHSGNQCSSDMMIFLNVTRKSFFSFFLGKHLWGILDNDAGGYIEKIYEILGNENKQSEGHYSLGG